MANKKSGSGGRETIKDEYINIPSDHLAGQQRCPVGIGGIGW